MRHLLFLGFAAASISTGMTGCSSDGPSDSSIPRSMPPPQDQYADINGLRLHYLDWGGSGTLLLLVPGLWHTAHTYNAIAPSFVDRYRVVAVTRRGHGSSDKPQDPVELDVLANDLAAFIDLFSEEPAIVVGQSYAGVEMPRLASLHPEKIGALVFLDAVYDWSGWIAEDQPPFPEAYNPSDEYESYDELDAWFETTFPEMWGEPARAHLRSQTYLNEQGKVSWHLPWEGPRASAFLEAYRGWTAAGYELIPVPVLSIQASFEGFFQENASARGLPTAMLDTARTWSRDLDAVLKESGRTQLEEAVPSAMMVEFDSTHHWLHLQRPERVVTTMIEFLESNGLE